MMGDIEKLIQIIDNSDNIVFFGGAGVSTESGIKDFRGRNGIYTELKNEDPLMSPEYQKYYICFPRHIVRAMYLCPGDYCITSCIIQRPSIKDG